MFFGSLFTLGTDIETDVAESCIGVIYYQRHNHLRLRHILKSFHADKATVSLCGGWCQLLRVRSVEDALQSSTLLINRHHTPCIALLIGSHSVNHVSDLGNARGWVLLEILFRNRRDASSIKYYVHIRILRV